jgi:hypothetical protein
MFAGTSLYLNFCTKIVAVGVGPESELEEEESEHEETAAATRDTPNSTDTSFLPR